MNRHVLLLIAATGLLLTACGKDTQTGRAASESATNATLTAPGQADDAESRDRIPLGRLPQHVRPTHYRLQLTIVPEQQRFTGITEIDLQVDEPVDHFFLHGRYLESVAARLTDSSGRSWPAEYQEVDASGVARISLDGEISGSVVLQIHYEAPFNQSLEGLYKVEAGGAAYAFTQFQAISAREAFPGFDEPAFKVPFDISLVVSEQHAAISNAPVTGTEALGNGLQRVSFATTPPLPTYLVAFAVGPFDVVSGPDLPPNERRNRPVPLRGIAVAGKGRQLQFALDNTREVVEALEAYFGTPYPYAKLDLIAVPDFAAGAMENAGAITYRDSLLLLDENARPQRIRWFLLVHAHELAHQWFGDLVTPVWWDDIWLNEAFATWMMSVALDLWQPDAGFRRDLASAALRVMDSDALVSARQIRQPVDSNHDIANAFDGITYSKGGAVLSMFEAFLGHEDFRAGVREHMRRHAWKTATADDFIDALASQSRGHEPARVASAFRSFIEQPGLPLLEAQLSCGAEGVRVRLSQSRYLPLGSQGDSTQQWGIPLCLRHGSQAESARHCLLVDQPEMEIDLATDTCPDFLLPNAGGAGYFRWSLDQGGWQRLLAASDELSTEEMMSVTESLDGAFNAGAIDVATYLQVARRLAAHEDWQIATAPMEQLKFIHDRLANENQRAQLRAEYGDIYQGVLDRVGMDVPADNDTAEMQALVAEFLAVRARLPELREELRLMAWRYTGYPGGQENSRETFNDNLLPVALRVAIEEDGAASDFSKHLESRLLASDDATFRTRALDALGRVPLTDYRSQLLSLVFSPQLRDNEFYRLITPQLEQDETRDATWDWLRENFEGLLGRLPEWSKGRLAGSGRYFCDTARRDEVEAFFEPLVSGLQGGPRSLAATLEAIELCVAKTRFHRPGLSSHLAQ